MKKRNCSIDIFRYVCAIMVVAIHTSPFVERNATLGYVAAQIIPSVAVPFFLITAGYYYIQSLEKGTAKLGQYVFRLLKIYILWSFIYYTVDFIQWGYANIKGFVAHCAYTFVVTGSHYHFWFFPAMIVSVCFVTVIYKLRLQSILLPVSILLYIIGCFGCSYIAIGSKIPGLSVLFELESFTTIRRFFLMSIPFFSAGAVVDRVRRVLSKEPNTHVRRISLLLCAVVLWLLEIMIVTSQKLCDNVIITFGLYILVILLFSTLLEYPCAQHRTLSHICHSLSDFTYYIHPLILLILQKVSVAVSIAISNTIMFLLTIVISALLVYPYHKASRTAT